MHSAVHREREYAPGLHCAVRFRDSLLPDAVVLVDGRAESRDGGPSHGAAADAFA